MTSDIKEYNTEIEDLFISFFLSCPDVFVRCKGIIRDYHYQDQKNIKTIKFLESHSNEFSILPTPEQVKAISGKSYDVFTDAHDSHVDWMLKEYEIFARHKELEFEILRSTELLEEGRYGEVESRIKAAVQIGLVKNLGTDYFSNVKDRLETLKNRSNMVPTYWRDLDAKLYGGFERGGLHIFAGQSGSGKSLFLQNLALNWVSNGMNVVYISLELSENLCSMRLDAMVTGYATKEVLKNIDDVELKVVSYSKAKKGKLQIKQLPNGCTANDIRAYVKEYEIQTQCKVDAIMVDYLDLCMPLSRKVSPSDLFVKDKYVSEELRNLAVDLNVVLVTASQLNRQSHEESQFGHEHIAGGLSKINTADNVFAIFTTHAMKESGRYQLQLLKTRSSAGVGSSIDLRFDLRSLRITDYDGNPAEEAMSNSNDLLQRLKKKSVIKTNDEPEPNKNVLQEGSRLRELLRRSDS